MAIKDLKDLVQQKESRSGWKQPKWQSLVSYFSRELIEGGYRPGEMLPSENYLAETTGFARSTIRQAFNKLEEKGFVKRVRGRGTVVTKHKPRNDGRELGVFGLIVQEIRRTQFPALVKGFDEGADEDNRQVIICNSENSVDKQANIVLKLLDKGVGGVAIVPTTHASTPVEHVRYMQANNIPVVFCHRSVDNADAPCVSWDMEDVGRIAGQAFIDHGHKDIMYFGLYRYRLSQAHESGLRAVLGENGLFLPENRVHYGPPFDEVDETHKKEQLLKKELRGKDRPTAIFCSDDTEAERAYWIATQLGLQVPSDLSIIGFGDSNRSSVFCNQLTSVVIDELDLGRRAARILCQMCRGDKPNASKETYYMPLHLFKGKTLGLAPT